MVVQSFSGRGAWVARCRHDGDTRRGARRRAEDANDVDIAACARARANSKMVR